MTRHPLPALRPLRRSLALLFTFSCGGLDGTVAAPTPDDDLPVMVQPQVAHANLKALDAAGRPIEGTLRFSPLDDGLAVTGELRGFEPGASHALHVHEVGDCSAPDGSSAGGHYAPREHPHGGPDADRHHLGDLGNVTLNERGELMVDERMPRARLDGELGVVGRAVVLHAGPDDLKSQPAGAAGDRIACGVIHSGAG
jgi:Cu-Zn family superoxide dismutase